MLNRARKVLHYNRKHTVAIGDEWHVSACSFPCCLTMTWHGVNKWHSWMAIEAGRICLIEPINCWGLSVHFTFAVMCLPLYADAKWNSGFLNVSREPFMNSQIIYFCCRMEWNFIAVGSAVDHPSTGCATYFNFRFLHHLLKWSKSSSRNGPVSLEILNYKWDFMRRLCAMSYYLSFHKSIMKGCWLHMCLVSVIDA